MGKPRLPVNEGEKIPVSFRIPQQIVDRIDAIGKASKNERSEVIITFLRWACDEWEAEEAKVEAEESTSSGARRRSTDKKSELRVPARRATDRPPEEKSSKR